MLNSAYGAYGSPFFRHYDKDMALAITVSGQTAIQWVNRDLNTYLNKILKTDRDYSFYSDTDSVVGSSEVNVDDQKMSIEDFYESLDEYVFKGDEDGRYVKVGCGSTTTVDDNFDVIKRPITHVMKHRVSKRLFRISLNDRCVVVTEDHSIVVNRDGKITSVTPTNIRPSDTIIII